MFQYTKLDRARAGRERVEGLAAKFKFFAVFVVDAEIVLHCVGRRDNVTGILYGRVILQLGWSAFVFFLLHPRQDGRCLWSAGDGALWKFRADGYKSSEGPGRPRHVGPPRRRVQFSGHRPNPLLLNQFFHKTHAADRNRARFERQPQPGGSASSGGSNCHEREVPRTRQEAFGSRRHRTSSGNQEEIAMRARDCRGRSRFGQDAGGTFCVRRGTEDRSAAVAGESCPVGGGAEPPRARF